MTYEERLDYYTKKFGNPFKTDKNGTKYFADYTCNRCGGVGGAEQWKFTGYKCYECGGSGKSDKAQTIKVYTPDYEKILESRRAKAEAKRKAEHDAKIEGIRKEWLVNHGWTEEGITYLFLGDTFSIKDEIKSIGGKFDSLMGWHIDHMVDGYEMLEINKEDVLDEAYWGYEVKRSVDFKEMKEAVHKANHPEENTSEYVGKVGDRLKGLELTVDFTTSFETVDKFSYYNDIVVKYIYSMKDVEGNVFVWITTKGLDIEKGDVVKVDGTVKEHKEYKDIKQTVLTRCKIIK